MDKEEKESKMNNNENIEETFILKLNDNENDKEEKMDNNSNSSMLENLTDEDYFLECARYNDFDELTNFIKQGMKLDSTDSRKNTALRINIILILDMAAGNGHLESAKILINSNLSIINKQNESGNSPLRI